MKTEQRIGERIADRRRQLGLSQDELAKKLGYKSRSTINKIELNINDITQSKVIEFARALDTSVAYLMGWEEEEKAASTDDLILELFRQLSDDDKREILSFIRYKLSQREG